jgi:hypothetical protein
MKSHLPEHFGHLTGSKYGKENDSARNGRTSTKIPAAKLPWNREFTKTDARITNARTISLIKTRAAIGFISPIKQARPMRASQLGLQISNA